MAGKAEGGGRRQQRAKALTREDKLTSFALKKTKQNKKKMQAAMEWAGYSAGFCVVSPKMFLYT